jgi:Flp pilus assembly protein TadB
MRRWISELPLGTRLYFFFWTLFLPAGIVLVFAGAVVPGLALMALFVVDQALVTPLLVARSQRRRQAERRRAERSG